MRSDSDNSVFYTIDFDLSYRRQHNSLIWLNRNLQELRNECIYPTFFETEEDNEALEKADITDILCQEAQDVTVDIHGSILMTTLNILVQNYDDILSTVKRISAGVLL